MRFSFLKSGFALLLAITTTGCSPWEQYYSDTSTGVTAPYSGKSQLVYSPEGEALKGYYAKGYTTIGVSMFYAGGRITDDDLQSLAERKEADVVVYWKSGERTKTMLVASTSTSYQPTQTYTTGSRVGNQFYGTSTSYGGNATSTTTVAPVTIHSADYQAYFLRKGK
jgi:hypothetical protein